MILNVCAMRDRQADCFGQPFFTSSIGSAVRSFGDLVNDPKMQDVVAQHPEDFDLYHLGTWDDSSASFELLPRPRQVAIGKDLVRPKA